MTEQQKQQALQNAQRSLNHRLQARETACGNSFSAWGNEKCISRTFDTVKAIECGTASKRQIRYWEQH